MVEGARLERVYTGNRIQGSNPCLSAIISINQPDPECSEPLGSRADWPAQFLARLRTRG